MSCILNRALIHYTSTFTVVVNPDKLQLNGGNDLTVTDTFSDAMELVTDSVQITLEPEGTSSWDFDTDKKDVLMKDVKQYSIDKNIDIEE